MSAAEYYDPSYNFDSPQSVWDGPSNEPNPTPVSGGPSNEPNPTLVSGEPSNKKSKNKKPSNKKSNPVPVSGEPSNSQSNLTAPADELKPFPWPKNYQNGQMFSPKDKKTNYVRHRVFVVGPQSVVKPPGSNFLVQEVDKKFFPLVQFFQMYLQADQESRKPISNIIPSENTELWVIFDQKRKEGTHLEPWQVKWRRA